MISIVELRRNEIEIHVTALSRILVDSVDKGAAIGFMAPVPFKEAERFWREEVAAVVNSGHRMLFAAIHMGQTVGTVQLIMTLPPNQSHRCEIAKMIVHPEVRRLGIGSALVAAALDRAKENDKTLVTLDTRTGDKAQLLYTSLGFEIAGIIPSFAWDPDGLSRHSTTYMYRQIGKHAEESDASGHAGAVR